MANLGRVELDESESQPVLEGSIRWFAIRGDYAGPPAWVHLALRDGRLVVDQVVLKGEGDGDDLRALTADDTRSIPLPDIDRLLTGGGRNELEETDQKRRHRRIVPDDEVEPLTRRRGELKEEFARRVAEQYWRALQRSRYPVAEMARVSGLPTPTIRTWVRNARRLGALPPGKQGRAG